MHALPVASSSSSWASPPLVAESSVSPLCLDLSLPDSEPAFDLLVIGCGGGPIESNLSCYLVKPKNKKWNDGCTALEGKSTTEFSAFVKRRLGLLTKLLVHDSGGSTIGAISTLVERTPFSFEGFNLGIGVDEDEQSSVAGGASGSDRSSSSASTGTAGVGREGGGRCAGKIWEMITSFAITHSHLDHISGLVLSSAACTPPPKTVYGLKRTVENLEKIMDGGPWPMLGGWEEGITRGRAYVWKEIDVPQTGDLPSYPLSPSLSMTALPISHGADPSHFHKPPPKPNGSSDLPSSSIPSHPEAYDSTAFFVRNDEQEGAKEFLFFGDVEPDSISARPLNRKVWEVAAAKIVDRRLNVIFLECSYPASQPQDKLFGHLSPPFVLEEMRVLAGLVDEERKRRGTVPPERERGPLDGVFVVIQHIKDDIFTAPPPPLSDNNPLTPPRRRSPSSTASRPEKPVPLALSSTRDSESKPLTSPLSMSPPIPTIPLRRPSIQLSQFSFPNSVGPGSSTGSAATTRRSSLFPSSFCPTPRKLSASSALSPSSASSPRMDQAFVDVKRRRSTPWAFGFGGAAGQGAGTASGGLQLVDHAAERRGSLSPLSSSRSQRRKKSVGFDDDDDDENGDDGRGNPSQLVERFGHLSTSPLEELDKKLERERIEHPGSDREDGDDEAGPIETVEETVHERIERELNELELEANLGVRFVLARQGLRLVF
ncbi:hypothetical protein JCM10212_004285 [Sporobolomyces blumeae]